MLTQFRDRREAGQHLAGALRVPAGAPVRVLALPRGGVPVAYEVALALGAPLASLGEPLPTVPVRIALPAPFYDGKVVVGEVISVDRFGNLVTNLTPAEVPPYAVLEVEDAQVGPLLRTFSDVETGQLVAYLGSGGQVEIAVRDGSAARRIGLGVGGRVRARLG